MSHSIKIESREFSIVAIFVGLVASAFPIFRGNLILDDSFHYGEFFAATIGLFPDAANSFLPLTIHGALDFIPALIAEHQWGGDSYFLPTFAIYKALHFLAATFIVLIAYELTKTKPYQWLLLLAVAAAAPLLVGYRDLVLLISIYLFFQINKDNLGLGARLLLQTLFGAMVAFGIFWSYDRGIAGSLSLGAAVSALLLKNRWHALSLMTFIATIACLSLSFRAFSAQNYWDDLSTLMATSGQWSYGWIEMPVVLTVFAGVINIMAISLLVANGTGSAYLASKLPVLLLFSCLSIIMLKIGINRADIQHIYWTLWAPMLISLYLYGEQIAINMMARIFLVVILFAAVALTLALTSYGLVLVASILVFTTISIEYTDVGKLGSMGFGLVVVGCLGLVSYIGVTGVTNGQYTWIKNIAAPPSNRLSTTEGVVWAADRLKEHGVNCIFDLSNNGVINGVARLPSCSRFTYPVYAGSQHESNLIADFQKALPPAIVYSSTDRAYNIDGRNMKDRFPNLDKFILKQYTKEECSFGYCLRYIRDSTNG
jgi:hypothetical protein